MTAINLPSPKSSAQQNTNVRPMVIRRDARQVVSLLELVFNQHIQGTGHHTIAPNFSIQDFLAGRDQVVPGFVYSINSRIVGNVSILESQTSGRYLIANVAVHPDFRRRGIARQMMQQVVRYIKNRQGHQAVLQVETKNDGAVDLYQNLGFQAVGQVRDWRMNWYSLKTLASRPPVNSRHRDDYGEFIIRPMRSDDTQAVRVLDAQIFPNNLNWPDAPDKTYFQYGLQSFFRRFFTGTNHEVWVAEQTSSQQIIGIAIIENQVGRPYMLKVRVFPEWVHLVERPLLAKLNRRLRYMRSKSIAVQQDVSNHTIEQLLRECGFSTKRTLTVMELSLPK